MSQTGAPAAAAELPAVCQHSVNCQCLRTSGGHGRNCCSEQDSGPGVCVTSSHHPLVQKWLTML